MTRKLVLAHDVGTSSDKAVLLDEAGTLLATASASYPTHAPEPGFAEQDPEDWWRAVGQATHEVMAAAGAHRDEVRALSFTGQMQGTLPVDASGRPLMRSMIWLDTRAEAEAREVTRGAIRVFGYGLTRLARWLWLTGGAPSLTGTDPVSKIVWLRKNRPEIWKETRKLLDVKDYLLFRSTGRYAATHDCANLTWLMDTRPGKRAWSPALLGMIDLPADMLPDLVSPMDQVGALSQTAAEHLGLGAGIPVIAGPGDVAAMAIGSGAVRRGVPHLTIGTSSWIAAHVDARVADPLSYVGAMCSAHPDRYLAAAAQQNAGSVIEWLRGVLSDEGRPLEHEDIARLASQCEPGASNLTFLPWFAGERTPMDDQHARGGFLNLDLNHGRPHLARAVLEGVALNTRWALSKLEPLIGGRHADGLRFVGGGARGETLPQIMADVLDRSLLLVERPEFAAARGCALLALPAVGFSGGYDALEALVPIARRVDPRPQFRARYDLDFAAFTESYGRMRPWFARRNRRSGK
jgi:xylulokinase